MKVPGFVLSRTNIKDAKIWHFYLLMAGWACVYTTMNVAIILFLQEALGNLFWAGLALSIGSVFALLFDGVFSYLQKIVTSRVLFMTSIFGMVLSVFLFFITFDNWLFVYLAAILFRISFDLCDITAVSYILAESLPAEYGQNLSYKQLAQGIGMISGFLVSAIILATSYFVGDLATVVVDKTSEMFNQNLENQFFAALFFVKVFLLILLICLWFAAYLLFDRDAMDLTRKSIVNSFQELEADTIGELKKKTAKIVHNIPGFRSHEVGNEEISIVSTNIKSSFDFRATFSELGSAITDMVLVFSKRPVNVPLIWSLSIMCIFSYWDTFLGTFMPIFFTEVLRQQDSWLQNVPGSILMFIFIVPVLGLLPIVAKWGDNHGRHYLITTGLVLTMLSALAVGIVSPKLFFIFFIAGFGVSFGYLFVMSAVRANTAAKLNEFLAMERKGGKIDSNAFAGSMMLTDNIGNIIGTLLGGALISSIGFQGFFILFAILLFGILVVTVKKYSKITGFVYVFQSPVMQQKAQPESSVE